MGRDICEGTPNDFIGQVMRGHKHEPTRIIDELGIGRLEHIIWEDEEYYDEADVITIEGEEVVRLQKLLDESRFIENATELEKKGFETDCFETITYMGRDGKIHFKEGEFWPRPGTDFEKEWKEFWDNEQNQFWNMVCFFCHHMSSNPKPSYRFYCFA